MQFTYCWKICYSTWWINWNIVFKFSIIYNFPKLNGSLNVLNLFFISKYFFTSICIPLKQEIHSTKPTFILKFHCALYFFPNQLRSWNFFTQKIIKRFTAHVIRLSFQYFKEKLFSKFQLSKQHDIFALVQSCFVIIQYKKLSLKFMKITAVYTMWKISFL